MNQPEPGFDSILASLIEADERAQGQVVDIEPWTTKYPHHADQIRSFFANRGKLEAVLGPRGTVDSEAPTIGGFGTATGQRMRYFGDYELLDEIARGGMGVVFKARQVSLNRVVAIKMILAGNLAGPSDVQRFHAEAEAAANLDHPQIVPIYEVGEHEGQHYFSMKLIEGSSLSQAKLQRPVNESPKEQQKWAASLVAQVARAVHHAHQRGILHRDLKPGNILLDSAGEPHVTDFGLAKKVEEGSDLTNTGAIVGTPSYMAPEQARSAKGLSTAADVYSLGAILYELLTGRPPFQAATPLDTILEVLEKEPARPSSIKPAIDHDLETITIKCLEKNPAHRYGSAEALADDLDRWSTGDPILARPISGMERTWKWVRRNPVVSGLLAASVLLAMGVVIALAGLLYFARMQSVEAGKRLDEVQRAAQREGALKDHAILAQNSAEAAAIRERTLRTQTEGLLDANRISLAHQYWKSDNLERTTALLNETPPDRRGWEWRYLQRLNQGELFQFPGNGQFTNRLDASQQGDRLVCIADSGDTGIDVWDLEKRKRLFHLTMTENRRNVAHAAISPDGNTLAIGERSGEVTLWNVADGKLINSLGKLKTVKQLSFYQRNRLFASDGTSGPEGSRLWETDTGKVIPLPAGIKQMLAMLPDGKHALCVKRVPGFARTSLQEYLMVQWNLETNKEVHSFGFMRCWSITPNGKWLAVAGYDDKSNSPGPIVQVVELATHRILMSAAGTSSFGDIALSHDGKLLATAPFMSVPISIWDVSQGKVLRYLRGHSNYLNSILFLSNGRLASCSWDYTVRVWDPSNDAEMTQLPGRHANVVSHSAYHPKRNQWAVVQGDNVGTSLVGSLLTGPGPAVLVTLSDPKTGKLERTLKGHREGVRLVSYASQADRLISGGRDGLAIVWDMETGNKLAESKHPGWVTQVAISPDGLLAASTYESKEMTEASFGRQPFPDEAGEVDVFDAVTGQRRFLLQRPKGRFYSLSFHPSGKELATSSATHLQFWSTQDGKELRSIPSPYVSHVEYTLDGQRLLALRNEKVEVWNLDQGQLAGTLKGSQQNQFRSMALSPDGKRLAISTSKEVKLFNLESMQELLTLPLQQESSPSALTQVAFTADGNTLLGLCYNGKCVAWETTKR